MSDKDKKGKLHELLAVEADAKGTMTKVREEAMGTFSKKAHLFTGYVKRLSMFDVEREKEQSEEVQKVSETVPSKLEYLTKSTSRYWDIRAQKETANQEARADVVIDGEIFFEQLPVSFLLGMEEELKQMRKIYDVVPTLQPGIEWKEDQAEGKGIYKAQHDTEKNKTEQKLDFKVIVPATKEHPAQVKDWMDNSVIGKYTTTNWSGMVTPFEKSEMLGKLDKMLRAFKKARQRANCQETKKVHVGKKIFDYINK